MADHSTTSGVTTLTLARDEWKHLFARVAELQTNYRDFGLRFYDLPSAIRAHLTANPDSYVAKAYIATSQDLRPTLADSLNAVSEALEVVPVWIRAGAFNTAVEALKKAASDIERLQRMCVVVFAALYRIQARFRPDLQSELQQARGGLVPEQLLAWCRSIREVKVALKLQAIEDDPHQVLTLVVDEEERIAFGMVQAHSVTIEAGDDNQASPRSS